MRGSVGKPLMLPAENLMVYGSRSLENVYGWRNIERSYPTSVDSHWTKSLAERAAHGA